MPGALCGKRGGGRPVPGLPAAKLMVSVLFCLRSCIVFRPRSDSYNWDIILPGSEC